MLVLHKKLGSFLTNSQAHLLLCTKQRMGKTAADEQEAPFTWEIACHSAAEEAQRGA